MTDNLSHASPIEEDFTPPIEDSASPIEDSASPIEDFDWTAYAEGDAYSKESREKLTETYDSTLNKINDKEVVTGIVTSISKREVVVNIGYKSDGVVSMNEFRYNPELKVGDEVEVYIESQEDKNGQLILSHKKARASRAWDRVNAALENNEIIKGYIKCRTKGGMIVDVFGIEAFLPGSQIDVKPIRDYDIFVDKTMEFKVVKINPEYKNVVVSHKALIEEELEQQKREIISKLEKGQVLEGVVKNITSYGAFVDLGGVDGLVHITDLSWGRVQHPEEVVKLDDKINVVILDFDKDKKRIALGLKQLTPHPWDALSEDLKVGDIVKGKVVVIADYGAFVEIAPGVEGLIHVSEMSWTQHLHSAQDFISVGEEVEAMILTLDREDRKMSLGLKQLKPDPWESIELKYPVGSTHTAKVRNFTNFGAFVEIEEGVEGLIHISDLSWTKKIKHPSEVTEIGAPIEVQVLDIDKGGRRLSLGHKQLEENPWDVFESIFTVGSIHEGTIVELLDRGAVVSLPYGVEGFATPKHMVKEDNSQAQLEEKLPFKVIEFNKDAKRIIVSHSRIHEDASGDDSRRRGRRGGRKESSAEVAAATPVMEKTTLGDIEELAALKEKLDNQKLKTLKKKAEKEAKGAEAKKAETKEAAKKETKAKEVEVKAEEAPKSKARVEKAEAKDEEAPKVETKPKAEKPVEKAEETPKVEKVEKAEEMPKEKKAPKKEETPKEEKETDAKKAVKTKAKETVAEESPKIDAKAKPKTETPKVEETPKTEKAPKTKAKPKTSEPKIEEGKTNETPKEKTPEVEEATKAKKAPKAKDAPKAEETKKAADTKDAVETETPKAEDGPKVEETPKDSTDTETKEKNEA
jgi:small subunit ribosomal protein S1